VLIGLAIAGFLAAAFCLLRLVALRREIRGIARHLRRYNRHETAAKLTVGTADRSIQALAEEINRHTELIVQANAERRRTEDELRKAVANMSHDLRTPLTSISGYIQLLESRELPEEEKREAVGIIKQRADRLQSLLNVFFELTVLDSTDYSLKPEKLRLNRLLPDILLGFYDKWSERRLEPTFRLPEEPIVVFADESAVRRVVENLMVNTIRHAAGSIDIALEAAAGSAVLTIGNDAPHLQGFDLELLFNRFYMADRSRSGRSSGLGLSIARGLMHKMGGELTAEMKGERLLMKCEWKLA